MANSLPERSLVCMYMSSYDIIASCSSLSFTNLEMHLHRYPMNFGSKSTLILLYHNSTLGSKNTQLHAKGDEAEPPTSYQ